MNSTSPTKAPQTTPTWIYVLVTVLCISFLAAGFFFAARQHFVAVDLGMKNSKLRKQLEDLEGENRRLVLNREIVRSPLEVKRIATRRGLRPADDVFAPERASAKLPARDKLVQKTSMNQSAQTGAKPLKAFYAPGVAIAPTEKKKLVKVAAISAQKK